MDSITVIVISQPGVSHLSVLEDLPASAKVVIGNSVKELSAAIPEAQVILNANFGAEPFRTIFPQAKNLKWIHSLSAGVEAMVSPEVLASPIPLTNGKGVFRDSLAEFTIGAMLFFAKDLKRMERNRAAGRWEQFDIEMLEDAKLGIVGYGEIGKKTAQLAKAFGMKVIAIRRRMPATPDPLLDMAFRTEQLADMLPLCDYLQIAAPNTPETRGMIGEVELALLKPSAVIVNVGRGPVIMEAALVQALEAKKIKGAALDVFDQEPLAAGHPFYSLDNVLMSPHCADHTSDWIHRAMRKFVSNFKLFAAGEPLDNIVDKQAGY
jgi:phosphoglycerate dehydrogenase-like enzyme